MEALTEEMLIPLGDGRMAKMFVRGWRTSGMPKATVICLHGFADNSTDFEFLGSFLAESGYNVYAPDLLGRGRSTYLGDPSGYSLYNYYRCIASLQKYWTDQVYYIANSWGGIVLLTYLHMAQAPNQKVVFNDVVFEGGSNLDYIFNLLTDDSTRTFDTKDAAREYVRGTRNFLGPLREDLFDRYLDNRIIEQDGKFRLAYDPAAAQSLKGLLGRTYSFYELLTKVKGRLLLLYGRQSKFGTPEAFAKIRAARADALCVNEIDAGHPPSLMTVGQALMVQGFFSMP